MDSLPWIILAAIWGMYQGWALAHRHIAVECKRLGGFFVGKTVFKCVDITEKVQDGK